MLRMLMTTIVTLFAWSSIAPAAEARQMSADSPPKFTVVGANILGLGVANLKIRDGRIEDISTAEPDSSFPTVNAAGRTIVPAFIDSHVHLAYAFSAQELAHGGIAAAVDLSAPVSFLESNLKPMTVMLAGPMITAISGYPTKSWGSKGYGLQISGIHAASHAVDVLYAAGARVIKMPVGDATGVGALTMARNPAHLTDQEMKVIVDRAHSHGMKVAAHALNDADVRRAAAAGVDVLAHTPTEALSDETIALWSDRAVISTLAAFDKLSTPARNLRRLSKAGATVLYGTDMGYTVFPGINPVELELLAKAGLSNQDILAAGTTIPAKYWGFGSGLGSLSIGGAASFLILENDPLIEPANLSRPIAVYIDGRKIK
ncbi:MAG: imidazolonepropionase-like amidohydrolase [Gammaproteobacteria bacterium]|jgi:imidazolonepropionase-like amidohydrolase